MKTLILSSALLLGSSLGSTALGQAAQQSRQNPLGYFGAQIGNELDTSSTGCYIGTAGSLVTDGVYDYILSNSHVLAREGEAAVGEDIMHTVSSACSGNALHVGELAADVPLRFGRRNTNRVDAAVARITPNVSPTKDGSGNILHIGNDFNDAYGVSPSTVSPSLGLAVKKSGRTTGYTQSSISQIGVNVTVRYNGGRAYFTDQFVVSGGGFSDSGDSGSLIVTNDASANPVGLLFAGSSSSTIANPINVVLSELGAVLGSSLSFGSSNDTGTFELSPPPPDDGGGSGGEGGPGGGNGGGKGKKKSDLVQLTGIERALAVRDRNEARLLDQDGILGSGIGSSNGAANITVFVNRDNPGAAKKLPKQIEGIPVVTELTDEFVAF